MSSSVGDRRVIALAPSRLDHSRHRERKQRAGDTDDQEGGAPAPELGYQGAEADADGTADDRRDPLQSEGPAPDLGRVVVGHQRLRRRVVDGLARAEHGADTEELPIVLHGGVEGGDRAPRRHHQ